MTEDGARRYGVVIEDGRLDLSATEKLRSRMADKRGATQLFDRGFENLHELKARSKRETGFDAPKDPVFATLRAAE